MASGKRTRLPIQETLRATGLSPGKDSLEKGTPVFLPGEPPGTEEPGGLQSKGSQRVAHN